MNALAMPIIKIVMIIVFILLAVISPADARSLQTLFKQVDSSVVLIRAEQREISGIPGDRHAVATQSTGSGVLISDDGKVVTAAHVVHTADRVIVEFVSGEKIKARVLVSEPAADLALLELSAMPAEPVIAELADSDDTETGEDIFLVGAPYGIRHSVTAGIISARHAAVDINNQIPLGDLFQTDAAINMGNSGGPVFNMKGQVVGIVSQILSHSGGFEGIGFAVTSNTVKELVLSGHGIWTGFQVYHLDQALAAVFNLPQPGGLLVEKVAKNSVAHRLGLRAGAVSGKIEGRDMILGGDVILEILDVPLHGDYRNKLRERFNLLVKHDKLYVKILREGKLIWLSAAINE
ncbi:MAG: trypsin-like peptidase domain-containing protein [Gammaproteobacteria bacterium]|nr:trypsin-like peptidase domain-containing protein [Gammaproteobacteria bacterium]